MSGTSDNMLWMQRPEIAAALRRRRMGEQLMQQGTDSSPIQSPWQGLSRLAQALVGGYQTRKGDEDIQISEKGRQDRLAAALAEADGPAPMPQMAPQPMPSMPPQAATPSPVGTSYTPPPGVDPDLDLRIRTTYGEARGEPEQGQQGVDWVIRNRARAAGRPISDIVFAPGQFEPWNNPATRAQMLALDPASPEYQRLKATLEASTTDPTGGATHFYSPRAQAALGREAPSWAQGQPTQIGGHNFYNLPYAYRGGGGQPAAQPSGDLTTPAQMPGQPQGAPQPDYQAEYARAMRRAAVLEQNGEHGRAQMEMTRAQGILQMARIREPLVNIDQKGEGTFAQERGKTFAARATGWEEAETKGNERLRTVQSFRKALEGIETGFGSETQITLGQIAKKVGVPAATVDAMGLDVNSTAKREEIRSLANRMVVSMLGAGGFPASGFSNADRDFLTTIMPGLGNSSEGNRAIMALAEEGAKRDIAVSRAWREWRKQNGESPDSVRRFEDEKMPGLSAPDGTVQRILEDSGWKDTTPTGAPTDMPLVSSPEDAAKLPPGTQFRTPDGRTLRVPAR